MSTFIGWQILNVNNEICDELLTWIKQKPLRKILKEMSYLFLNKFCFLFLSIVLLTVLYPSFMSPRNKISGDYSLTVSSKQNITMAQEILFHDPPSYFCLYTVAQILSRWHRSSD